MQAAGALPGDGWLQRIAEGLPFGPVEKLLAAVRGSVYARATAQDAGYGSRPKWPSSTRSLVEAAAPALEALEQLLRPLIALGKRLEAVIEDAPDWLDAQARARIEGAIGGLGWRTQTLVGVDRAGGAARRPGRSRFRRLARGRADRRARVRYRPAPPLARSDPAARRSGAQARARRDRHLGDAARAARTGRPPRRAPARAISTSRSRASRADSPFDYAANSEVLIVTDVQARRRRRSSPAPMRG